MRSCFFFCVCVYCKLSGRMVSYILYSRVLAELSLRALPQLGYIIESMTTTTTRVINNYFHVLFKLFHLTSQKIYLYLLVTTTKLINYLFSKTKTTTTKCVRYLSIKYNYFFFNFHCIIKKIALLVVWFSLVIYTYKKKIRSFISNHVHIFEYFTFKC